MTAAAVRRRSHQPGPPHPDDQMWLGRYPGNVWMWIVWLILSGGNLAFAVAFPANLKPPSIESVVSLVWVAASLVLLFILGARTPRWFIHLQLVTAIFLTALLIYTSVTNLGAALFGWAYCMVAMYTSMWLSRRTALAYLAGVAALYLGTLGLRDDLPYMLVTWLLTMTVCVAITLLLSYLIKRLRTLATVDPLTGLLNRVGLESVLGDIRLDKAPTALVISDLDNFKTLNDSEGHLAGDRLLQDVGQAMRETIAATDYAFRTGGDEFMLILPGRDVNEARNLVERVASEIDVELSTGIVNWPPGEDFDSAMSRADELMYETKRRRS